jgi:hypothetical protein
LHTPLFSKNNRFKQEKNVQFIRRLIIWEKTGLVQPGFQINRQPGTDMTRKKVSEIQGLKKRVFIEKPEKMLPECLRVAKERMLVQDSYLVFTKNRIPTAISCLLDLSPFPVLQVIDILGNLAGMVSTAFKVPGDNDVVRTARDILRVFYYAGNTFPEDRVPECIDRVISG